MRAVLDSRATAVVAFSDLVALGAMAAARAAAASIPERLSLIGFDDIPSAEFLTPEELDRQAWELLRATTDGMPATTRWLTPSLIL